jgi:hypothetical protein
MLPRDILLMLALLLVAYLFSGPYIRCSRGLIPVPFTSAGVMFRRAWNDGSFYRDLSLFMKYLHICMVRKCPFIAS